MSGSFSPDDYPQNPFAADASVDPRGHQELVLPPDERRGRVGHVFVLGVLMAVYGGIVLLCGIGAMAYAAFAPDVLKNDPNFRNNPAFRQNPQLTPEQLIEYMQIAMAVGGGVFLVCGLLYLIAGIQVSRFRSRTLALVALSAGLITILGCYCIPTSVAIFVYGLIVLLNSSVRTAFTYGDRGYKSAEIQQAYARLPLGR